MTFSTQPVGATTAFAVANQPTTSGFTAFFKKLGDSFASGAKALLNSRVALLTAAAVILSVVAYVYRSAIADACKSSYNKVASFFTSNKAEETSEKNLEQVHSSENLDEASES